MRLKFSPGRTPMLLELGRRGKYKQMGRISGDTNDACDACDPSSCRATAHCLIDMGVHTLL